MRERIITYEQISNLVPEEILGTKILLDPYTMTQAGCLYASQMWIDIKKVEKSKRYVIGDAGKLGLPLLYLLYVENQPKLLVGDGHHRTAEALLSNIKLLCEIDEYLGNVDLDIVNNKRKAEIRFARYGIQGIWPFTEFVDAYKNKAGR